MMHSKSIRSHALRSAISKSCRGCQRALIEILETRTLLSSYLVTGTADGPGVIMPSASPDVDFNASTLRGAIAAANADSGADTISFDASLAGQKIMLDGSELPAITHNLTITGLGADQFTIKDASGGAIWNADAGTARQSMRG